MRSYPFDKLLLLPEEKMIWQKLNPTFHRSRNWAVALTTHHFCLWYGSWPGKWEAFPLHQIEQIVLTSPGITRRKRQLLFAFILIGLVALMLTGLHFTGWLFLGLVIVVGLVSLRSEGSKHQFIIKMKTGQYEFETPEDTEEDEQAYDLQMCQEALSELKKREVPTVNNFLRSTAH